jgi:hypothetical protein
MELAEQSPTSSAADVNKLSCAIHSIPKSPQEQLPCSPHDAFEVGAVAITGRLLSAWSVIVSLTSSGSGALRLAQ